MQVVSSYGAEIKNKNIPIRHTLALYREAVRCLTEIYETVWTELSMIDQIKRRFNEAEHLVHETKKNHARFDFDARFPKMPSYLRRAAIQHALGSVSSYHTRLEQWKNGAISGKPKLVYEIHAMPVFYRNVMYKPGEDKSTFSYDSMKNADYTELKKSEKFTPALYHEKDGIWEGGSTSQGAPGRTGKRGEKGAESGREGAESREGNGKKTVGYDEPIIYKRV